MSRCLQPLAWDELVDYAAGDLAPADADAVEEHLMRCEDCSREAERLLALTTAVAELPPPVVSAEDVARLRARGLRVGDNVVTPSQRSDAIFRADLDILVHHLTGLDLAQSERVDLTVRIESSGQVVGAQMDVPFDRSRGELLVACQRHFAVFPPDVVFEVRAHERSGAEVVTRYVVPHVMQR